MIKRGLGILLVLLFSASNAQKISKSVVAPGIDSVSNQIQSFYVKFETLPLGFGDLEARAIGPSTYQIICRWRDIVSLRNESKISYIQKSDRTPVPESLIRQHDLAVNAIWSALHNYPNLSGDGVGISIKENAFNASDPDIAARSSIDEFSSTFVESHATEMATLAAGSGISYVTGTGVARGADLYSTSFINLLPEPESYFRNRNIYVQNHSYGVGIENFYGVESRGYDQLTKDHPSLLHSFSIGNSGRSEGTGIYEGIEGYGTITGSFKQAKNVVLSTSSDTLGNISDFNSRGPTYDGRIKPDLVAFGGEGTSESAALISGGVALLQEKYLNENDEMPHADLIRALLIAGADDMLTKGPDYVSGFGQFNLLQSLQILDSLYYEQSSLVQGQEQTFNITIPPGMAELKVVLVWNDLPADEGSEVALVNDLDLRIEQGADDFLPWILDSSPTINNLELPATRGVDHLNNVEMISVENPSGDFTIRITGFDVTGTQNYAFAYAIEPKDYFEFIYPTASNPVDQEEKLDVYWKTNLTQGNLEISYDGTDSWEPIVSSYDLNAERYRMNLSAQASVAQLRMSTPDSLYYSDQFQITKKRDLQVDLNCDDRLILKWNRTEGAFYDISVFNGSELLLVSTTTDTLYATEKADNSPFLYRIDSRTTSGKLLPSFLVNVNQQNAGCYINSFLVVLGENQVELRVGLSGISEINDARIFRSKGGGSFELFEVFEEVSREQSLVDFNFADGVTQYRLDLITKDGSTYSSVVEVLATREVYIPFPTIVTDGYLNFLSPKSGGQFELLDAQGFTVKIQDIVADFEVIELVALPAGVYFYRVAFEGSIVKKGKIIIR